MNNNSSSQGNAGLALAIGYFASHGFIVCIPLSRHQSYDLLVDDGAIKRVKVVTTSFISQSGSYQANLRVLGGNNSETRTSKNFNQKDYEYVFVVCNMKDIYVIPSQIIYSQTRINLSKYKEYKYMPS